jgi:DNA polymerase III epsilon subunit-like protein
MLVNAQSADEAFNQLFDFIELNSDGTVPTYYCYGNTDADFIAHTVKYMIDTRACICAQAIKGNLIDYASIVKNFFHVNHDLALCKVYMLIKSQTDLVQKHDALEDALMLQTVVNSLYRKCKPEDKDTIMAMPSQKKPKVVKKAPLIFNSWNNQSKWEAAIPADEDIWVYRCIDIQTGKIKYFDSINTAALWVIKYIAKNTSPKNSDNVNRIKNAILNANKNNKNRYGCKWEYNPEGAIKKIVVEEE